MNIHVDTKLDWYRRLLVDVRVMTGVQVDAPDALSYEWCLIEAPTLEKQVLQYIEGTRVETPSLPEWLMPLWDDFTAKRRAVTLRCLRQLLLFYYKTEQEPTNEQLKTAQGQFESTDQDIAVWDTAFKAGNHKDSVFKVARQIVNRVSYAVNFKDLIPKHGPGAVFPPRKAEHKSRFSSYYPAIAAHFPYDKYFYGLPSFWTELMVDESRGEIVVVDRVVAKLTAVPKDSRGPRLISVHPAEAIWIQQAIRTELEMHITRSPLLKGRINFRDQSLNGGLALESSKSGHLCTLDLKEASDRISSVLVEYLFGTYQYDILSCSRASHIVLFDGRVIELRKWAMMGNALCFPVQSLIFYALVRAGIRSRYNIDCDEVYVFGDDILFPSKYYEGAVRALVMAGCKPNMDKTFRNGLFRESCGVDAYNGEDVTPLRLKKQDMSLLKNVDSLCSLAKRLRLRGFEHVATSIYSWIERYFQERLPKCNDASAAGIYEWVDWGLDKLMMYEPSLRWSSAIHQWQVRTPRVAHAVKSVRVGDWYHLQDSLLNLARKGDSLSANGTEYPMLYRERLEYGWATVGWTPNRGLPPAAIGEG